MRRFLMALASAAVGLAVGLAFIPSGIASSAVGGGLSVSPEVAERATLGGRLVQETVQMVNLSDVDYNVSATLTPLQVEASGRLSPAESGSSLPSADAWGSVEPAAFLLPRGNAREVKIGFTPPEGTAPKGYFAAVKFTGAAPDGSRTTTTHAVLLEVGGPGVVRAARVAGVSAPSRAIGNEIPVSVRLENTGNVAVMASGTLTLRDATSRVTAVIPVTRAPVIPGYPRTLRFKIPAPVIPGSVRVTADIGFGEGVPRDTATTMAFAVTWWQAGVVVLVLLVLVRLVVALVRRRRRRKAAKRRAPATVAAPPATAATAAARTNGAAVAASPSRAAPILADDELQSFWDDPDARRYEGAEPEVEVEPEPEKEPAISAFAPETPEPQTGPSPYAALEPEPAPEPEPLPAASLTVVPPVAAPAQAEPEEEPVGARVSALVDRVKAGMPEGPAGGPQASLRRALVALELMTERGARSVERIDVGLGLLRWATGDEAVAAVEAAFDGAAAAGKKSAIGAIALAMAEVGSPRATEALLRAYAAAPRHLAKRLRDALRSTPEEELRDRGELLAALPEDRRSALKVG